MLAIQSKLRNDIIPKVNRLKALTSSKKGLSDNDINALESDFLFYLSKFKAPIEILRNQYISIVSSYTESNNLGTTYISYLITFKNAFISSLQELRQVESECK